jgi:hypothetical protein
VVMAGVLGAIHLRFHPLALRAAVAGKVASHMWHARSGVWTMLSTRHPKRMRFNQGTRQQSAMMNTTHGGAKGPLPAMVIVAAHVLVLVVAAAAGAVALPMAPMRMMPQHPQCPLGVVDPTASCLSSRRSSCQLRLPWIMSIA